MNKTYRHYKNDHLYEVLHHGTHTETRNPLVVYRRADDPNSEIWIRPYQMFYGQVEHNGQIVNRFQEINIK